MTARGKGSSARLSINWEQPIRAALDAAEPKPAISASAPDKKNYAERLSRELARVVADGLRAKFPKITPDSAGGSQESLVGADSGKKRLDVKAWDDELGLVLSVSIKTYSFPGLEVGAEEGEPLHEEHEAERLRTPRRSRCRP